jgi:hypothetical protein
MIHPNAPPRDEASQDDRPARAAQGRSLVPSAILLAQELGRLIGRHLAKTQDACGAGHRPMQHQKSCKTIPLSPPGLAASELPDLMGYHGEDVDQRL